MHDIAELERRGVPGVFVATEQFLSAAEAQAASIGFDPAAVYTEHPIQDRTDAEMGVIAEQAVEQLLGALTGSG